MFLLTVFVIVSAVVFCLALAAASSPVYGFNAKAELGENESERRVGPVRTFLTSHQGVPTENQPTVSAAGMQ